VPTVLVGRSFELGELRHITERARSGDSATLVIRGEPGVGKTVLLDELETLAYDFRVIRTGGVESELKLDYAALHRIVLPFMDQVSQLPAPQRNAIEAAFGLSATGRPDQFLVGLATLTLLGDSERSTPLLVIVDDAHWLDTDSMTALAFVGRRLHADHVALVFAVRDFFADQGSTRGLPELHVKGLAEDPARELLTSLASTPVQEQVAVEIIAATAGNPLALSGLATELTEAQLAGLSPLPDPLPTGELIEATFARQVELLPKETQIVLLLAAAEPTRDLLAINIAAGELGTSLAALEPAEELHLISTKSGIEFRHPLIRSAVYSSASAASRRDAHLALAGAVDRAIDPEHWATHRALAAVGPDEEVATALEDSAVLARARGGYAAETALLARSAELSPLPQDHARRLLAAAYAANLAGNSAHAQILLEAARQGVLDDSERARAQLLDGMIRVPLGQGWRAPALLLEAAKSLAPLSPDLSRRALLASFSALLSVQQFAEGTTGEEIGKTALSALQEGGRETTVDSLLRGMASMFVFDFQQAASALRHSLATFEQMSAEEITEWYYVGPVIANALWDPDAYRLVVELLETAARQQGAILALQPALLASAAGEIREGRFSSARTRFAELLEITEAVGGFTSFYALIDVELLAWEGEEEAARKKIQELIEGATALGSGSTVLYGLYALSILELGQGRYPEALIAAQAVGATGMPSWSSYALPLIVEAAMRCADVRTATEALEQVEERAQVVKTPFALGLMWRCKALVRDDDETEPSFRSAIELFGKSLWHTEVARTHLLYGEWLRRKKRRTDARAELRRAHDMFQSMGAKSFAERARIELAASGERARTRSVESGSDLTARELQIAQLAADGLTSREIASQLFISPNTAAYHLKKVFQKLGINSRTQLVRALPDAIEMDE
jgi:DNA-binding CsgD family transcriptional regulator